MPRAAGTAESVQETCRARPHPAQARTSGAPVLTAAAIFIRLQLRRRAAKLIAPVTRPRLDGVGFRHVCGVHQQAWGELERIEAGIGFLNHLPGNGQRRVPTSMLSPVFRFSNAISRGASSTVPGFGLTPGGLVCSSPYIGQILSTALTLASCGVSPAKVMV